MTPGDMEKLARMAAKEAVSETFLTLGLDIKDPISVQNQFATLRNIHYSVRHIRNVVIGAVVSALVSGAGYVFWTGFKANAAPPASISARP